MKDLWKIAFAVVTTTLAAGVIYLVNSQPRGKPVTLTPPPSPAPILVHVAGAVAQPGVYSLPRDSRVRDAVEAAGGALPEADLESLNLAATLEDGERLLVPGLSQNVPEITTSPTPGASSPTPSSGELVDINSASRAELEALPGIGLELALRIIAHRQAYGPFETVESIQEVFGVDAGVYERIKDLITVGE